MSPPAPEKRNVAAPNVPYFLPLTQPPPGTELPEKTREVGGPKTKVFEPLTIRGVEFKNRIWASPMCMYSSDDGHATDWHLVHLGSLAARGVGAICVEATAVVPEGRISPEDAGLWTDSQIAPLKRITTFVHGQGTKIGVQLAHAGRKASTVAPWVRGQSGGSKSEVAHEDAGGWPNNVYGPSPIAFSEAQCDPIEADEPYLANLLRQYELAAQRCKKAGFDFVEIHGAHGYALHSFMSPLSNVRKDKYGGSLENRLRFPLEVAQVVRKAYDGPIFFRLSATDWAEGPEKGPDGEWKQWGIEQSIILTGELEKIGIDLIDVSSGGNWSKQKINIGPGYQVPFAAHIKQHHPNLIVSAVGLLTEAEQIESILRAGHADVVMVARELLRNADFVLKVAEELGVVVKPAVQYDRAWTRMTSGKHVKASPVKEEAPAPIYHGGKDPIVGDR